MKREFTIDLKGARSARAIHSRIAAVLPVPSDYGRNYDALYDFLTEYASGWKLVFTHAGAAAAKLRQVCADAAADLGNLEIAFE